MTYANAEKQAARRKLKLAVRYGRIERQPCEVCGDPNTDAHHEDYGKPLDVRWLCRAHHAEAHHGPSKPKRAKRPAPDPEMVSRLQALSEEIRTQQAEVRALESARNGLVMQALAAGVSQREVARITGLSAGRIGQLATRKDQP